MTEKKKTTPDLSFDEEVEAFLTMDPEERARQAERLMAERIVYYRRKARAEGVEDNDSN
jgi:hypothetical protein